MTSIGRPSFATADAATAENSRSTMKTLASPWPSMKAIDSASSRVFSALSTQPAIGMPKCASTISGVLGSITATVSPRPRPRRTSACASFRQRSWSSPQLRRSGP